MKVSRIDPDEASEQIAVVQYCALKGIPVAHVPNEGKRSVVYGSRLKEMGLSCGFPDLVIPEPRKGYHGLFIEMKTRTGKATEDQKKWLSRLSKSGYLAALCHGFEEAREIIDEYFG